jgi:hypothetical protein
MQSKDESTSVTDAYVPAGERDVEARPHQCVTTRTIQHHVAIPRDILESLAAVVDGDVRAKALHEVHVALPHRGEHGGAEVASELDGDALDVTSWGGPTDLI